MANTRNNKKSNNNKIKIDKQINNDISLSSTVFAFRIDYQYSLNYPTLALFSSCTTIHSEFGFYHK